MINNLEYVAEGEVLLSYDVDGIHEVLPFSAVQEKWLQINTKDWEFWSELDEESFEGGTAKALNDHQIIATAYIASGQSGAVFIWDVYEHQIVHISNGAFAVACTANERWVYTLCLVSTFTQPPHLILCRAPIETNDWQYSQKIQCELPFNTDEYMSNTGIFEMDADDRCICFHMSGSVLNLQMHD